MLAAANRKFSSHSDDMLHEHSIIIDVIKLHYGKNPLFLELGNQKIT